MISVEHSPEVFQDLGIEVDLNGFTEEGVAEDLLDLHTFLALLAHGLEDEVLGGIGYVHPLGEGDFIGDLG